MRKLFQQMLVKLSKKDLDSLTQEVKETIYVEHDNPETEQRFTSAELWKIQQRKRTVTIRRGYTNW
jgi:transposase-like protein